MFEQELDKEVKVKIQPKFHFCLLLADILISNGFNYFLQAFVVNVIQFRNSFDSQGPGVPGVRPAEAVARLHDFQQHYTQFEAKRKTLDSVQLLFGIVPTPFPELDKTGEVGYIYLLCSFTMLVRSIYTN